jgi:hypothetical protein
VTVASTNKPGPSCVTWAEKPLLLLRKTVLSFLHGLFEQADNGYYRWVDGEETEIFITDESPIKLQEKGRRPAINIVRGPLQWGQTSLDEVQEQNIETGQRKHTDLLSSNLSINCCSREPLESEDIAWIVANHMWLLRRILMKNTPIHEIGRRQQVSSPTPAGAIVSGDTEGEWIATTVTVPFFIQTSATITPQNQGEIIKAIEVSMGIRGAAQLGRTNVIGQITGGEVTLSGVRGRKIRPPSIRGVPIRAIAFEQSLTVRQKEES